MIQPSLTGQAVLDVIHQRRAVRAYAADAVDDGTIQRLLDAAVHAPTAMHLEPWAFVVIQDRALLARLSDRAKRLALERARPANLAATPGASSADLLARLASPAFNIFYDAGTLIVICGKPLGELVAADCWLAAENLMLAATGLGLGTCCIGFAIPVLNQPEIKAELGIPPQLTAIAPILVGWPAAPALSIPRKPPEVLRWIR